MLRELPRNQAVELLCLGRKARAMKVLCFVMWLVGAMSCVVCYLDRKEVGEKFPTWLAFIITTFYIVMACIIESW